MFETPHPEPPNPKIQIPEIPKPYTLHPNPPIRYTSTPIPVQGCDCAHTIPIPRQAILSSKTIIWNGPMGVFEMAKFEAGTAL